VGLLDVVVPLLGGVALMLAVATAAFVGVTGLRTAARNLTTRTREVAPHFALLVLVIGVNRVARHAGPDLSWFLGLNITGAIFAVEGALVADIQSVATPWLTTYFSFVYLYGYVFLTLFPFLAYFALEDLRPFKHTVLAYAINYSLGLLLYTLFISYGPRNLIPGLVEPLLYTTFPQSQLLTSKVNVNTNVFPSLHTSLSVTVMLLAYRSRSDYPGWFLLTVPLATSVVFATMYLGIHWFTDVVAGSLLAFLSVRLAVRYANAVEFQRSPTGIITRW
jgi:membrane-associated phospholipid phosphatase